MNDKASYHSVVHPASKKFVSWLALLSAIFLLTSFLMIPVHPMFPYCSPDFRHRSFPSVSFGPVTAKPNTLFFAPDMEALVPIPDRIPFFLRRFLLYRIVCGDVRLSRVSVQPLSASDEPSDPGWTFTTRPYVVLVSPQQIGMLRLQLLYRFRGSIVHL